MKLEEKKIVDNNTFNSIIGTSYIISLSDDLAVKNHLLFANYMQLSLTDND